MNKLMMEKVAVTLVLVLWWVLGEPVGYGEDCGNTAVYLTVAEHALAMVSHAGFWHLVGNLFVLWILRWELYLLPAALIALVMSFVPVFGVIWPMDGVTMGFSGVLFAIVGIKWGLYCQSFAPAGTYFVRAAFSEFCYKILPFALIGVLIPHVNWCLHLYCLLTGFAYGAWRWRHS